MLAMAGKNCVAIAADTRYGIQAQTIDTNFSRVFKLHDKVYYGLSGLATDVQTLDQRFKFHHKLYSLREERNMKASVFGGFASNLLYKRR